MHLEPLYAIALIGFLSISCQWLAWRVRLPAIVFLLLTGIAIGPGLGWLRPDELFKDLLFPFVSLSVAVILFEGSLTLRLHEIRGMERVVRRMVSVGALGTWLVASVASYYFLDFSWELALLFGAIMIVTGPTVVVPMLRTIRPKTHLAHILRWEGIIIDPVGALVAVLVYEFIISGQDGNALGHTLLVFAKSVSVGLVLGIAGGALLAALIRRYWIPQYLHNVAVLTLLFSFYALSDLMQEESGLITVTVMGIWLANQKNLHIEDILNFKESLSILLISGLFILLAARINVDEIVAMGWAALGVFLAIQFVARPIKVLISTWGTQLSWQERALLGWIAPRGIVAAAVAALFAIRLSELGYEQASLLVPLTFLMIIGTVVLQSATARPLAVWLGVAESEPNGFLIIGANPLARVIARGLKDRGIDVVLVDDQWEAIRSAQMQGLTCYYGSVTGRVMEQKLDLSGIGRLMALHTRREVNDLAIKHFRTEFGDNNVFILLNEPTDLERDGPRHGRIAFGASVHYAQLNEMLAKGARIHQTRLSEMFDYNDYYRKNFRRAVPLFSIDPGGKLHVLTTEEHIEPAPDWSIVALVLEDEQKAPDAEAADTADSNRTDTKSKS